jgi:hypothetical protein
MQALIDYLRLRNWTVYHTFDARRSAPGFLDIVAVRAGRLCFIETKTLTGKLSPAQEFWFGILGAVPCVETYLLRPSEEDWQRIERTFA